MTTPSTHRAPARAPRPSVRPFSPRSPRNLEVTSSVVRPRAPRPSKLPPPRPQPVAPADEVIELDGSELVDFDEPPTANARDAEELWNDVESSFEPEHPPASAPACPCCGELIGRGYSHCITCGYRLETTSAPAPVPVETTQGVSRRMAGWLRRVDPRRPRWMDEEEFESIRAKGA